MFMQIKGPRGNNLHDVEEANGNLLIASMPVKYRKSVWMKRGKGIIIFFITSSSKKLIENKRPIIIYIS